MNPLRLPKWHNEINKLTAIKSTFLLDGNIYDRYFYQRKDRNNKYYPVRLNEYLKLFLKEIGYEIVICYNFIDGFYNPEPDGNDLNNFLEWMKESGEKITGNKTDDFYPATIEKAYRWARKFLSNKEKPVSIIFNLFSRFIDSPENLSLTDRRDLSQLFLTSIDPTLITVKEKKNHNNLMFFICDKINDIPAWFYLDNPHCKAIHVTKPDKDYRRFYINNYWKPLANPKKISEADMNRIKEEFVNLTDGFQLNDLIGISSLCLYEDIDIINISEAISFYKYGIKENPWDKIDPKTFEDVKKIINDRVKGQEQAKIETLDILKRAIQGMTGIHRSSMNSPKGILFFAGPTGTGKTELAKSLAQGLFGDEDACIRFDMSEYQQEHSDQKLLGAPPGYIGYEAGGQLTNAIKDRPFSILLFDEIEKAHHTILDKFLQILEDGRMTDGQGETVYFAESILIFTSNLGIYKKDEYGNRVQNVKQEIEYEELCQKVMQGIKDYFHIELGRPEIINRIGNNFVFFDFISDIVANEIFESQLKKITSGLKDNQMILIDVSEKAKETLSEKIKTILEYGGRGIGNTVEKYLINPLSRYIYDNSIKENDHIIIKDIIIHKNGSVELISGEEDV